MAVTAVITSLNPTSGPIGTHVQINGSNFIQAGLHGVVVFPTNVDATTVYSYSNTQIIVAVPPGATTGNVFIEFPGGNSNSKPFNVSAPTTPTISSLNPSNGGIGIAVTVNGTNFGATQNTSTVTFNGIAATVTSWSPTAIVVTVPAMATTGPVIVTVAGVASNSSTFTVTNPSNGGTGAPIGMFLIPCQQFDTQVVLAFDFTDFDDPSIGSFYAYKVQQVIAGRTPTVNRVIVTYRDLGVVTFTIQLSGIDQNTLQEVFLMTTATVGTAGADNTEKTLVWGINKTLQNIQLSVVKNPGDGPLCITGARTEGRVELTPYG
jgi:hypothetical protein